MEQDFVFRPYGKSELALLYIKANVSQRVALNWLNQEIALYPGLLDRLHELGYKPKQRIITLAQLRAIVDAIGAP